MRYVFIENPIAGNKAKQLLFKEVQSSFRWNADAEMIIEETHYKGHAKEIAADYAAKYGKECVVVTCGGDGTVHEAANGLAHTETPLMILPFGTGNDFAKKVYKTKKLDALKLVKAFGLHNGSLKYTVKPIDLIDYNGEKCINVMSYGLDTKVETLGKKWRIRLNFLGISPIILQLFLVFCNHLNIRSILILIVLMTAEDHIKSMKNLRNIHFLLFATEAIMAAASALLPIHGLMTGFWIMHLLML